MKKRIVFFARDYQADFFPKLQTDEYESIFVAYNLKEKRTLEGNGVKCYACFEEMYDDIGEITNSNNYLETSFTSDRYLGGLNLSQRIIYLGKSIRFWRDIFNEIKPYAVVNEVIAIEFSEVMYIEAKKQNIKYLAWMISPFSDRQFYWLSNPFHASLDEEVFQDIKEPFTNSYIEDYIENLQSSSVSQPYYIKNLNNRYNIKLLLKLLKNLSIETFKKVFYSKQHRLFYFDHSKYIIVSIKSYICSFLYSYDRFEKSNNYDYVFYPLHYEPEASLTYFAEFYDDQINTIRNLSKCLKQNQYLVVKEHPQQPGILLTKKFRELRKSLSNILYIPAEYSTRKLIEKVRLVITISSTAGWESLMLNKPVFVLGKVFYDKHPNINVFISFDQLKQSIRNDDYKLPNRTENVKYVKQFYNYCNEGNPYPHRMLFSKNNILKITKSIKLNINNS